jgi:hypothetical protein
MAIFSVTKQRLATSTRSGYTKRWHPAIFHGTSLRRVPRNSQCWTRVLLGGAILGNRSELSGSSHNWIRNVIGSILGDAHEVMRRSTGPTPRAPDPFQKHQKSRCHGQRRAEGSEFSQYHTHEKKNILTTEGEIQRGRCGQRAPTGEHPPDVAVVGCSLIRRVVCE